MNTSRRAELISMLALVWSVVHDFIELPLIAFIGWLWLRHPQLHLPLIGAGVVALIFLTNFIYRQVRKARMKSNVKTLEERVQELEQQLAEHIGQK